MNSSGMGGAEIKNLKYRDFLEAITCKVLKNDRDYVEYSIDIDIERDHGNIFLIEQKMENYMLFLKKTFGIALSEDYFLQLALH